MITLSVIIKDEQNTGQCGCCGNYVRVWNGNAVLDNSWKVSLNGKHVGTYSGTPSAEDNWKVKHLNAKGKNHLVFERQNCVNDDWFEIIVQAASGEVLFSGDSGYRNPGGATPKHKCGCDKFVIKC